MIARSETIPIRDPQNQNNPSVVQSDVLRTDRARMKASDK